MEGLICQLPGASRSLISSRRSSAAVRMINGGAISFGQGRQSTLAIQSQSKRRARNISLRATQSPQVELLKKGSDQLQAIPVEKDEARWETLVKEIKEIFRLMDDGETNASAYDTAWVARIPSTEDSSKPHFPQTVDWILKNQLEDGSWGEPTYYLVFDRLVCTLSCVLALKTWNLAEDQIEKGLNYLKNHVDEIETASESLITSGFEIAFPSMLNEAKSMGIDLPYDRPSIRKIIEFREKKMSRIPVKVMHSVHTTLLYTLEALQEVVQWDEILKLQSADGSFLSSASSTAAVYMNTGDKKCLDFLQSVLNRFGDNLPCQYPIDLFERIWAIDTIARLGIDHLFKKEIIDTLDYVYKYSGKQGVSWGRDNTVPDVDDTCMALRLMRMYGYPVSSDMIEFFRDDDGNFICFPGQTHRGVSDMFNLYRFSQVAFPGEKILKEANVFVEAYLKDCVKNNKVDDKWSCKKALGKEVARGLEYPWRRSFPRLDAREYLDHYGDNDVWLAKTIYLIYNVTNPKYLELAKLEFNRLQAIYEKEIGSIVEWWNSCGLEATSLSPEQLHFAIASTLPEPEFATSRIAYTKSNSVENVLVDLFYKHESTEDLKNLCRAVEEWNPSLALSLPSQLKTTFNVLYETLNELAGEASKVQGKDVFPYFHELRKKQMEMYMKLRETKLAMGGQSVEYYSLNNYIELGKTELGVAVRLLPSVFLMGERLRDLDLLCLNENSRIQEKLSVFLRLYIDLQMHKNSPAQGGMNAVALSMEEGKRREEEALGDVEAQMEEAFDELVHESLKPSLVPRSCRRLMFEHARITQFFLHDDFTSPAHRQKIAEAMERFRTPVPIDGTA